MVINGDNYLLVECKWLNKLVDRKVLSDLYMRAEIFPYQNVFFMIFSKFGYTYEALEYAKQYGICTIIFKDM